MKRYLFLGTLLLLVGVATMKAQTNKPKQTLTQVLDRFSKATGIHISFSPSLTDKIFPSKSDTEGDAGEVLTRILEGTGFVFKCFNDRHYYVVKAPIKRTVKKTSEETPREKNPVDALSRLLPLKPLPVASVSTPPAKLPLLPLHVIRPPVSTQKRNAIFAIKTNLLYDLTASISWGIELGLGNRTSLEISGSYNPWTFSGNRKMKHWLIQPEFRYWICSRFSGHFWGVHAHYAQYNWGNISPLRNRRYEGRLLGGGISYGYRWIVGKQWGLEAEIGAGYAYLKYDKFRCEKCGDKLNSADKHYFGPTKMAINLIWMIK